MSKLLAMRQQRNGVETGNSSSCKACGRMFQNSILLTNYSTTPLETYNACPFCFARQDDEIAAEKPDTANKVNKPKFPPIADQTVIDSPGQIKCSHEFGYLKNRPKNSPIPDECLTCKKMIQCLTQ